MGKYDLTEDGNGLNVLKINSNVVEHYIIALFQYLFGLTDEQTELPRRRVACMELINA